MSEEKDYGLNIKDYNKKRFEKVCSEISSGKYFFVRDSKVYDPIEGSYHVGHAKEFLLLSTDKASINNDSVFSKNVSAAFVHVLNEWNRHAGKIDADMKIFIKKEFDAAMKSASGIDREDKLREVYSAYFKFVDILPGKQEELNSEREFLKNLARDCESFNFIEKEASSSSLSDGKVVGKQQTGDKDNSLIEDLKPKNKERFDSYCNMISDDKNFSTSADGVKKAIYFSNVKNFLRECTINEDMMFANNMSSALSSVLEEWNVNSGKIPEAKKEALIKQLEQSFGSAAGAGKEKTLRDFYPAYNKFIDILPGNTEELKAEKEFFKDIAKNSKHFEFMKKLSNTNTIKVDRDRQ